MSLPTYNLDREPGEIRLQPRLWHSRWYVLQKGTAWIEGVVEEHSKDEYNARVIDLGCGAQPYRALFEAGGMTYHGVDLPGNEAADSFFSKSGITTASDGSFDVALSLSVLEHVENPGAYLDEAHRILRPGGHLVLATHGIWIYHPDPEDYWRWTCEGLKRQIVASGFEIVDFKGSVGLAAAGLHLVQDSILRRTSRLHWPIVGRLARLIEPLFTMLFQLTISLADLVSNDRNRGKDAMGFYVIARSLPNPRVDGAGTH